MYDRYIHVPPPKAGERHTVWYRTRMMVTVYGFAGRPLRLINVALIWMGPTMLASV